MRLFQYFPDHDRAISVNQVITVKETTVSFDWNYMIQKSNDRVNWVAYTTPLQPSVDNSASYKIPSDLAGFFIRFVIGGSTVPILENYTLTGESTSPVFYVLTATDPIDSIFSDIEVRSADNLLISKNNHGEITYPIIHLNREPVKDDFQDFENVLAIINRPTYFTFNPAPLIFTSGNGFSHFAYISSNAHWIVSSIPDYIQIVREGRIITSGNGTLSFNIHVDTSKLSPGIYNEYIIFENTASGDEIHVPLMIDVDVPLTVNEESEVVNIVFYRDADAQYDSEELRIVRDRYWQFANFEPLEQYFDIGRIDGSHNAVTILSLKPNYSNTTETTYTFFCISNNYIVRINVTVRISAYCQLYPRSFLFYPGQVSGFNTTPTEHGINSGFNIDNDGNLTQILTVHRFNYKLVTAPSNLGSPPWLTIEEITTNLPDTLSPVVDQFRVTFNLENALKAFYAGYQETTLAFTYNLGITTNNAGGTTSTCYFNIPRIFSISTVNENPNPDSLNLLDNNGTWSRYEDLAGISYMTSDRTPYLYTTRQEIDSKTTSIIDVQHNLSSPQYPSTRISPNALTRLLTLYTDPSSSFIRGAEIVYTTPESWIQLRGTVTCTITIAEVRCWDVKWSYSSETSSPDITYSTYPQIAIIFPIEARRQHFLRGNDLGTLLPDFDYRRLGARFIHNPNCSISAHSKTSDIELILHIFQTSGSGFNFSPTSITATHVGAQLVSDSLSPGYHEYGRSPSTALSITSRVLTKIEAADLNSAFSTTEYVGYDDGEFIGHRNLTSFLSTIVFYGYDSDNLIPVQSAYERFTVLGVDTPLPLNSSISVQGTTSGTPNANTLFLDYAVKFNISEFPTREEKPYLLYEFARPRVIRGLALHQPPKKYSNISGNIGIIYYIETRIKHSDDSFGNWQPLMVTNIEAPSDELSLRFRTCVPRIASEVRIFRKYNWNQVSYDTSGDWEFGLPYFHFYENTPLFYTSTEVTTQLGSNIGISDSYTGELTYPGQDRSLPFFNSYIGFLLFGNPANSEQQNWDDIANGKASHQNATKSSSTYFSGECQNYYRYDLVSRLDLSAPTLRAIAGRNPLDNYVKLVPARRLTHFNANTPTGVNTSLNSDVPGFDFFEPIQLTGAILYSPTNSNIPFAGSMLLQSSLDDTTWPFDGNTAIESSTGYELSGITYSPFAIFSVGNYFGAIRLRDNGVDHKTTSFLLNPVNIHILDEFAREVSNLLPFTPKNPITILNDNPLQGSLLRGVPLPTSPPTWDWTTYGATLYLTSWSNVATIYTESELKNDPDDNNKNTILQHWVQELSSAGETASRINDALGEIAIYAPAQNISAGVTPNFKRYKYNNDHPVGSDDLPSSYTGTWTDLTTDGTNDIPFYFEIEPFYHQTLPLSQIKYLSLSCGGLINIFNNVNNALQYGEVQLFHRYTGIETFLDNLPETSYRRSQTFNGDDRYYHNTITFSAAGYEFAEDWVDCYCGSEEEFTPTNPRQTKYLQINTEEMRLMHAFQDESNITTSFTNNTPTITFKAEHSQSNTLCTELAASYTFGVPFFTYIRIAEQ